MYDNMREGLAKTAAMDYGKAKPETEVDAPPSPIAIEVNRLADRQDETQDLVRMLTNKLDTVLAPEEAKPEGTGVAYPAASQLHMVLIDRVSRQRYLNEQLRALLDRVTL